LSVRYGGILPEAGLFLGIPPNITLRPPPSRPTPALPKYDFRIFSWQSKFYCRIWGGCHVLAGRVGLGTYFRMPLSSKNSTGSLSLPCSHISEKNQMPLSPIQKSAGVKVMFESGNSVENTHCPLKTRLIFISSSLMSIIKSPPRLFR